MSGMILKSVGSSYTVLETSGKIYRANLKGKFKLEGKKLTNPLAVGDYVKFYFQDESQTSVVIDEIEPRQNYIIRRSAHKSGHGHILAANIDHVYVLATLVYPETSLGFIDRCLVAAESFRIPTSIVFNKSDLYKGELMSYYASLKTMYEKLNYKTYLISVENKIGIQDLQKSMENKKILITGHSGVGKSSLLNLLSDTLKLKTSPISNFANKGTHTTTFAEMFQLDNGILIIDTPGIKEFGLVDIEPAELSSYFPEMRELIGKCRFHNCLHIHEPDCMVIKGVEEGLIAESRYTSYLSIIRNENNRI